MSRKRFLEEMLESGRITQEEYRRLRQVQIQNTILAVALFVVITAVGWISAFYALRASDPRYTGRQGARQVVESPMRALFDAMPLSVRGHQPEDFIRPADHIYVTFSKPMVEDTRLFRTESHHPGLPVAIDPSLSFAIQWVAPARLEIIPDRPLAPQSIYRVSIRPSIAALSGESLGDTHEFEIKTPGIEFGAAAVYRMRRHEADFRLTFSAPVNARDVTRWLDVLLNKSDSVPYDITGSDGDNQIRLRVRIDKPVSSVRFRLHQGFQPAGSNWPSAVRQDRDVPLDRVLHIGSAHPDQRGLAAPSIRLSFTDPVDAAELRGKIRIDPPVAFAVHQMDDWYISLIGDLAFDTLYHVVVGPDVVSRNGYILAQPETQAVRIAPAQPRFEIKSPRLYQLRGGELVMPVNGVNIDTLHVTAHRVYPHNLVAYANAHGYEPVTDHLVRVAGEKFYAFSGPANRVETRHVDLADLIGSTPVGAYVIGMRHDKSYYRNEDKLILITGLGLVARLGKQSCLAAVHDLKTGKPVEGAEIELYARSNLLLGKTRANREGIAVFDIHAAPGEVPAVVVARHGDDYTFFRIDRGEVSTADFPVTGRPYLDGQFEALIYGDRDVYRPGEAAHFKAIVRGRQLALPPPLPVVWTIADPRGRDVFTRKTALNANGTALCDWPTATSALSGRYTARLTLPGDARELGSYAFQLEDFIPDQIKTTLRPPDAPPSPNAQVLFGVEAAYLYGAPAAGNSARAVYSLVSEPFRLASMSEFTFGDSKRLFQPVTRELSEIRLDAAGCGSFTFNIEGDLRPPSGLMLVFTATVNDESGRGVSDQARLPVHAYPLYIGLKSGGDPQAPPGRSREAVIRAVLPNGSPTPLANARVQLLKEHWRYVYRRASGGDYEYDWERVEDIVFEETRDIPADGLTFEFTPPGYGSYRLRVEDPLGGAATALPVQAGDWWMWYEDDDGGYMRAADVPRPAGVDLLSFKTDKPVYRPGETAKLQVSAPFDGDVLVFLEQQEPKFIQRVSTRDKSALVSIPLSMDHAPNVYATCVLIRGMGGPRAMGQYRAFGVVPIRVEDTSRRRDVEIDVPGEIRPGRKLHIGLRAEPGAEISLSAVDEGILQLTGSRLPDPFGFFHAQRMLAVETFDVYGLINPEPHQPQLIRRLKPGGDEAMLKKLHGSPVRVTRVKPAAFWFPSVVAGSDGRAEVDLDVPEFHGSLVVRAVAADRTGVGSSERKSSVREPVLIEFSAPRAVASGDSFLLPLRLHNSSPQDQPVHVRLRLSGAVKGSWAGDPAGFGDTGTWGRGAADPLMVEQTVTLAPRGQWRAQFGVLAANIPGAAVALLTVNRGGETATRRIEFAVRPPVPPVSIVRSYSLSGDTAHVLDIPDHLLAGTFRGSLVLSRSPDLSLGPAILYLMKYPYGCVEQTSSATLPLIYFEDLVRTLGLAQDHRGEIRSMVAHGIDRLFSMQNSLGLFGAWPGADDVYPWGTVYAAFVISEAKRAGHAVPEEKFRRTLDALKQWANDRRQDAQVRAYCAYVLSQNDIHVLDAIQALLEDELLPAFSRYQLIAALSRAGHSGRAGQLLTREVPDVSGSRLRSGNLNSAARDNAVMLLSLLDVNPGHPGAAVLAQRLAGLMDKRIHHWGTTQDNAFVLLALGKYLRSHPARGDFRAQVFSGDRIAGNFSGDQDTASFKIGSNSPVVIDKSGPGALFVHAVFEGVPVDGSFEPEQSRIALERTFHTIAGAPVADGVFQQGRLYVADLRVVSDGDYDNVFLDELLPGGLEIENPRLATRGAVEWVKQDQLNPEFLDIQDDRLVWFGRVPRGVSHFRYSVRAVSEGEFRLPPANGGCMYDPSVWAMQGGGRIRVMK